MDARSEFEAKKPLMTFFAEYAYQNELIMWVIIQALQVYSKQKASFNEDEVKEFVISKLKKQNAYEHDPLKLSTNPSALLPDTHSS